MATPAAIAAVSWITKAIGIIGRIKSKFGKNIVKTKRYLKDLRKLENVGSGRDTNVWMRVEQARLDGSALSLDHNEVQYLSDFKGLWDKNLKKPLVAVAKLAERGPLDEVIDLLDNDGDDDESGDDNDDDITPE